MRLPNEPIAITQDLFTVAMQRSPVKRARRINVSRSQRRLHENRNGMSESAKEMTGDDVLEEQTASENRGRLVVRLPNAGESSPSEYEEEIQVEKPAAAGIKVSYSDLSKPKNMNKIKAHAVVKQKVGQLLQPLAVCEVYQISKNIVAEVGTQLHEESETNSSNSYVPPQRFKVAPDLKSVHITFDNSVLRYSLQKTARGNDAEAYDSHGKGHRQISRRLGSLPVDKDNDIKLPNSGHDARNLAAYERRDTVGSAFSGLTRLAVLSSPKRDSDFSEFEDEGKRNDTSSGYHAALHARSEYKGEHSRRRVLGRQCISLESGRPNEKPENWHHSEPVVLPRIPLSSQPAKPHGDHHSDMDFSLELPDIEMNDPKSNKKSRPNILQKKFDESLRIYKKTREKILALNSEKATVEPANTTSRPASTNPPVAMDVAAENTLPAQREDSETINDNTSESAANTKNAAEKVLVKKVMFHDEEYAYFRHSKYRKGNSSRKFKKKYDERESLQYLNVNVGEVSTL